MNPLHGRLLDSEKIKNCSTDSLPNGKWNKAASGNIGRRERSTTLFTTHATRVKSPREGSNLTEESIPAIVETPPEIKQKKARLVRNKSVDLVAFRLLNHGVSHN